MSKSQDLFDQQAAAAALNDSKLKYQADQRKALDSGRIAAFIPTTPFDVLADPNRFEAFVDMRDFLQAAGELARARVGRLVAEEAWERNRGPLEDLFCQGTEREGAAKAAYDILVAAGAVRDKAGKKFDLAYQKLQEQP